MADEDSNMETLGRRIGIKNEHIRICLAEMLGTFIVVLVIDSTVAQKVLTEETKTVTITDENGTTVGSYDQKTEGLNTFLGIQLAHFLGIAFGIYISGGISGGHVNPAVTLAMALIGRVRWSFVPFYFIGQFLGAFASAPVIYGVYFEPLNEIATKGAELGIWATRPWEKSTTGMAIGDTIVGTFILVIVIMAVTDKRNLGVPSSMVPIAVGMGAMGAGLGFGVNGFALNPARDFGPRCFECILNGSGQLRTINQVDFYFWIPGLIPFVGAFAAAVIYLLFIEIHHPRNNLKEIDSVSSLG